MLRSIAVLFACCVFSSSCFAQPSNRLMIRVVDVGAGLCCIAKTPDDHYLVYDGGNYVDRGASAMTALRELIPYGSTIDLLVISHCDADHLAAVPFICEQYRVKEVWRDGLDSGRDTWARMDEAVRAEAANDDCEDRNLQETDIEPGESLSIGENATATFLCGFAEIPDEWLPLSEGENKNARSIVIRLDYGDASVLIGGDTVGRHTDDPSDVCIAAESVLVDRAESVPIDVDVVIAPHHGADNGSSAAFIEATSPRFVVFSAGSDHEHPRAATARRYLRAGVPVQNIFRTDRGDNEGGDEWRSTSGADRDRIGDDDVELLLSRSGQISVQYRPRTLRWFNPELARSWSANAIAPAPTPPSALPVEIAKWVNDDSLWTEDNSHIEDHTVSRRPLAVAAPPDAMLAAAEEGSMGCQSRYRPRLLRRWRGCRCR